MMSFVFDTTAFVSLESIHLLDSILENFVINTSNRVWDEITDFAAFDDLLGEVAKRVLQKKKRIAILKQEIEEDIPFVSQTDKEIFNLALSKQMLLITDDIKLTHHATGKIQTQFSTYFLPVFTNAGLLTKNEALQKLEQMRKTRNWRDNVIYLSAKEELNNIKD